MIPESVDKPWLMLGDCLDRMREIPDGSVHSVITDPPYNVGIDYGGYDDRRLDYREWCGLWLAELERVCSGPIAITTGQVNLSMWATIKPPKWWLAWWKPAAMGRSPVGFNNWEPIALYGKPKNQRGCDVIRAEIEPDTSIDWHPCPKPLGWAVKQVEMFTEPGEVVLDPFSGSGTTGRAARLTGRRFVGIERNPDYHAHAERLILGGFRPIKKPKRIKVAVGQLDMFGGG